MPKFRVEIVYAYEIEVESKNKAERHGLATQAYLFDDVVTDETQHRFSVCAIEVIDGLPLSSSPRA